jgi:hypothetical protein
MHDLGERCSNSMTYLQHILFSSLPVTAGKCEFPQFLRRSNKGSGHWLTEVVYKAGTTDRDSYINITVTKTTIEAKLTHIGLCNMGPNNCKRTAIIYTMDCLQQHDGKYVINRMDPSGG